MSVDFSDIGLISSTTSHILDVYTQAINIDYASFISVVSIPRIGQDGTGQDRTGQDGTETGQDGVGLCRTGWGTTGWGRTYGTGQDST